MTASRPSPRAVLEQVPDPEIPVLSIVDLGIVRAVRLVGQRVEVTITPTYSGCPALRTIRADLEAALHDAGYPEVSVCTVLAPPWTTDWITERGRRALAGAGIAPPAPPAPPGPVPVELAVPCPQCGSRSTRLQTRFGAAPCLALRVCAACREPFAHFKTH